MTLRSSSPIWHLWCLQDRALAGLTRLTAVIKTGNRSIVNVKVCLELLETTESAAFGWLRHRFNALLQPLPPTNGSCCCNYHRVNFTVRPDPSTVLSTAVIRS